MRIRVVPGRQAAIKFSRARAEVYKFDQTVGEEENCDRVSGALIRIVRFGGGVNTKEYELRDHEDGDGPRIRFTY